MKKNQPLLVPLLMIFASFLMIVPFEPASVQAVTLKPAELWAVKMIRAGSLAEFDDSLPEPQRTISGLLVSKLITDSLEGARIPQHTGILISGAVILGDVIVPAGAQIHREVELTDCYFEDLFQMPRAHLAASLVLNDSTFARGLDLQNTTIAGILEADSVSFPSQNAEANFSGINVGQSLLLNEAHFGGPVHFDHAIIGSALGLERATFTGNARNAEADLGYVRVGGSLLLSEAEFQVPANLQHATIGSNLELNRAKFENRTDVNRFNDMRVTDSIVFDDSTFEAGATFENSYTGTNFYADGTAFNHSSHEVTFNSLRVTHSAYFNYAAFEGRADFTGLATGSNLEASSAKFENPDSTALFKSMTIGNHAFFDDAVFKAGVDFSHSTVARSASFSGAKFANQRSAVILDNMRVDTLNLGGNYGDPPTTFAGTLSLDALSYQHFYARSWSDVLDQANRFGYHPDTYASMESLHRREGNTDEGNRAYILGRQRERRGRFRESPLWYSWNLVEDKVAGYGRDLKRALYLSALFIIFGAAVFWRESGMDIQKDFEDRLCRRRKYHAIWYSLALFLPIISLEDAKIWTPKVHRRFARIYMRLHIILGYLLIPIGLAAWTGIIK
jgi:hypothetical protein